MSVPPAHTAKIARLPRWSFQNKLSHVQKAHQVFRRTNLQRRPNPRVVAVYFDGLCEPQNPGGVSTYGFVVYVGSRKVGNGKGLAADPFSKESSNNVGEYYGLIKALEWLTEKTKVEKSSLIEISGDSKLVIAQMRGEFKVRSQRIAPLNAKAKELARQFSNIAFKWISRKDNREADSLSRHAYEEFMKDKGLKPVYRSSF